VREEFERTSDRLSLSRRMAVLMLLARATGDAALRDEARRLLDAFAGSVPETYRASLIENVPLHREIRGGDQNM